jgi:hypothetical protein
MIIELLLPCYGWDAGYETEVISEDSDHYYFYDEWERWSCIEKNKTEEYNIL